ncbi:MAG: exodeoxyribonuclease VII large subunit [Verrucomicrobiota bacterium]
MSKSLDLFEKGKDESLPLTVAELTHSVCSLLEDQIGTVWLVGELSNYRQHSSGHCYFTLKDSQSQLRGVMFRGDAANLSFSPGDGDEVLVKGMITVYVPRGEYQIRVFNMRPKGQGSLQEQFEALKFKLSGEGLFDQEKKKKLPLFPQKIGVITSPTGAAVQDFLRVITRRCPRLDIQIFGVHVQGSEAIEDIVDAIEEFNQRAEVDLLVLTRGGGSLEDLWSFNEEAVARAIADSEIPVVSAIGHEVDFTISDFVADFRAPTPSAAAELISTEDLAWIQELGALETRLGRGVAAIIKELSWKLSNFAGHYVFREPIRLVEQSMQRLDECQEKLEQQTWLGLESRGQICNELRHRLEICDPKQQIVQLQTKIDVLSEKIRLLSPRATLERGYTIVFDKDGRVLRRKNEIVLEQELTLEFFDGNLPVSTFTPNKAK